MSGSTKLSNWIDNGANITPKNTQLVRVSNAGATAGLELASGSNLGVSNANEGRIIYDTVSQQFMISVNGGAYQSLNAGSVTGAGVATRVAFWSGATTLSSDANIFWDNVNKRLGIGTATPAFKLDVSGDAQVGNIIFSGLTPLVAQVSIGLDALNGIMQFTTPNAAAGNTAVQFLFAGGQGGNDTGGGGGTGASFSVSAGPGGAGTTSGAGQGGAISITAGNGGAGSGTVPGGPGGTITFTAGQGGTNGGAGLGASAGISFFCANSTGGPTIDFGVAGGATGVPVRIHGVPFARFLSLSHDNNNAVYSTTFGLHAFSQSIQVTIPGISNGVGNVSDVFGVASGAGPVSLGNQTATLTNLATIELQQVTYTSTTNVRTVTNGSTLLIAGPPINGGNVTFSSGPFSILVQSGICRFISDVQMMQGQRVHRTAVGAGNYTVLNTDYIVAKTAITGGGDTITLPTAASAFVGRVFVIKDESGTAATNNITIATSEGNTIDGAATFVITLNRGSVQLYTDGVSSWFIY